MNVETEGEKRKISLVYRKRVLKKGKSEGVLEESSNVLICTIAKKQRKAVRERKT